MNNMQYVWNRQIYVQIRRSIFQNYNHGQNLLKLGFKKWMISFMKYAIRRLSSGTSSWVLKLFNKNPYFSVSEHNKTIETELKSLINQSNVQIRDLITLFYVRFKEIRDYSCCLHGRDKSRLFLIFPAIQA